MKVLDLFSGIGGFSYGLEQVGDFQTVAFCETDPFCQRLLKHHWPTVPTYPDIRELSVSPNTVDVITGGFPCQDVSYAAGGETQSLLGDRSGLWFEMFRIEP